VYGADPSGLERSGRGRGHAEALAGQNRRREQRREPDRYDSAGEEYPGPRATPRRRARRRENLPQQVLVWEGVGNRTRVLAPEALQQIGRRSCSSRASVCGRRGSSSCSS